MTNAERAERVAEALRKTYEEGHYIAQSLEDLLCDIRHLCDREGLDFVQLNNWAGSLYEQELYDEHQPD